MNAREKKVRFRINTFFGQTSTSITLDSDREDIEMVFSKGQCHSFAMAAQKLTGWPLFASYRHEDEDEDNIPNHVFLRMPNGNYFDVEGEQSPENFASSLGRYNNFKPVSVRTIRSWVRAFNRGGCGYLPSRVKDAMPFAKQVLKVAGVL